MNLSLVNIQSKIFKIYIYFRVKPIYFNNYESWVNRLTRWRPLASRKYTGDADFDS